MHSQKQHNMSKEAQRPPRYPLQKKNIDSKQPQGHDCPASRVGLAPHHRHYKSLLESYIDEEKPPWLDDLLSELGASTSYSGFKLSSSSYSLTFLDILNELGASTSRESDDSLESSCTYGPNSPKRRSQLTFPVSSAFSNSVSQSPLQNLDASVYESERAQPGTIDSGGTNDDFRNEAMKTKGLHPRQRHRAWKPLYIAELERTVSVLQTFQYELATKVSVMFQQRSTLQIENHKLKEQMIKLQQEKLLAEGQYQYLRKEAERLKAHLGSHSHMNKINTLKELNSASKLVGSEPSWQISDLWKLDLS